jgi:hypothetical protein
MSGIDSGTAGGGPTYSKNCRSADADGSDARALPSLGVGETSHAD